MPLMGAFPQEMCVQDACNLWGLLAAGNVLTTSFSSKFWYRPKDAHIHLTNIFTSTSWLRHQLPHIWSPVYSALAEQL